MLYPLSDVPGQNLRNTAAMVCRLHSSGNQLCVYPSCGDRGLLTFTDEGTVLLSTALAAQTYERLHLDAHLRLRWVAPEHHDFVQWHRKFVFQTRRLC